MVVEVKKGLEGQIAADSAITVVDGGRGELRYRGYAVAELALRYSFEDVVWLLLHGELPTPAQGAELRAQLGQMRVERSDLANLVNSIPGEAHPLDALRYVVSWDAVHNASAWDNSAPANYRKALEFVAWFPVVVAGFHRKRQGLEPAAPNPDSGTAEDFLAMLHGEPASEVAVRTLDTSLVLHADHELNASTFAARVTIATQSNLHSAIASALGTLAGPRHGGASDRVIAMLQEIGDVTQVRTYVDTELAAHRRIMGFGHRVYRVADPRSAALRGMARKLLAGTPRECWTDILEELTIVVQERLGLYPNVDLYAALVNHELGIDPAFYTATFAVARIAGWTAHAIEQLDGRMIRPVAHYIGPEPRSLPVHAG
jgi:citrate synthase